MKILQTPAEYAAAVIKLCGDRKSGLEALIEGADTAPLDRMPRGWIAAVAAELAKPEPQNAMRQITLATLNDQSDFGRKVGREAFANRQAAEHWAAAECEKVKADADEPEYCNPVADFETVWFTAEAGQ